MQIHIDQAPPVAVEIAHVHREHGFEREDPWYWLHDKDNPNVIAHLEAENAYTTALMSAAGDLEEQLYQELVGRIEEDSHSAPYFLGNYEYQTRIEKGQNYRQYYRRPRDGSGEWVVFFDANIEAEGAAYFDLGLLDVSPDGNRLAYAIDRDGNETYSLHFRNLLTGEDYPQTIEEVTGDGEWTADSNSFLYTVEDESKRPYQIHRYTLGKDSTSAKLVHEESDPLFYLGIERSQDEKWLFAVSASKETAEVAVSPSADGNNFEVLYPRREGIRYSIDHHEGNWLVQTNDGAPDFKLLSVPAQNPDLAHATTVWPARASVRLESFLPLQDYLIFWERENGLDYIRIQQIADGQTRRISMPDTVYSLEDGENLEFDTAYFNFSYSSPTRPRVTWRYHLPTDSKQVIDESIVPSGHDPEQYTAFRIDAMSTDGAAIPLTIVHRKGIRLDGTNPAFLYGYGAYSDTIDPGFSRTWLTWLQRGFVVAIAHVRGGGLLGEEWYQQGKLANKANSFTDFITCAERLIADGYTRADRLAIQGESAGGLLIGAVLNLRPDLFHVAVAGVPFVDTLSTMLDDSLPLTTFEYEEWGNPKELPAYEVIRSYSPFDNIRHQAYPAILAIAGLNDTRVHYWEAAKWVAKLRKYNTGQRPVLLKTNMDAGHSGATGRYDYLREIATEQAFILHAIQGRL